jgi:hypothetical protein
MTDRCSRTVKLVVRGVWAVATAGPAESHRGWNASCKRGTRGNHITEGSFPFRADTRRTAKLRLPAVQFLTRVLNSPEGPAITSHGAPNIAERRQCGGGYVHILARIHSGRGCTGYTPAYDPNKGTLGNRRCGLVLRMVV